ncbi:MAG: NUDIX domain-containing protein [bacterium]|nr:NUDIX domain-containing protein [bacterium]
MTEPDKNLRPKVGLGVMVMKDGKVLLGKRKTKLGEGEFAWPGGHLEYMESFEECVRREVREEAGIEVKNIRFLRLYNLKEYAPKHYVDLAFVAEWAAGELRVLEPEKCESWGWYELDKLPSPLFAPELITLDSYKTGKVFYDA